jgi:transcriptional regulator with XRE-family HTH domain
MQAHEVRFIRECGNVMRLKELREQNRLNQEGLALKLNVSQSTISAYEVEERTPDLKTLISIATFFGVSLDYLVGLSDIRQSIKQSELSDTELEYLNKTRQADKMEKERIKSYIDGILSK